MSAVVTVPPLPQELLASDDFMVSLVLGGIVSTHNQLVELSGTYETVREAQKNSEAALEESDDPQAVAFRLIQAQANADIDAINQEAKARKDAIRARVAEEEAATVKAITGQALSNVDIPALQETFVTRLSGLKKLLSNVKDAVPAVAEYVKTLPSATKMAVGEGAAQDRPDRGWSPRVSQVVVDGANIEPATIGAAAKALGHPGTAGRNLIMAQLIADTVTPDGLRTDPHQPHILTVVVNGEAHRVELVGKA